MELTIDRVEVPAWAWLVVALAAIALYIMTQENGFLLNGAAAERIHEFFHDGRHFLGVPCH